MPRKTGRHEIFPVNTFKYVIKTEFFGLVYVGPAGIHAYTRIPPDST